MDTMETTKIVGGVCAALLIYLLLNWAGELLYHVGSESHGDDHSEVAMMPADIYNPEEDEAENEAPAEEGPSLEELLAAADVAKGTKVFSKCKACHKVEDGANGVGPHLFAVVDRAKASVDGFTKYSSALQGLGGNWDAEALNGFLTNPKKYAPGTGMSFAGLKKPEDRANLIAYLQTLQ